MEERKYKFSDLWPEDTNAFKRVDEGFCITWINNHFYVLDRYIRRHYQPWSWDTQIKFMVNHPVETYWILKDFLLSDEVKIGNMFKSLTMDAYVFFVLIASPGYGKTCSMLTVLDRYKRLTGRKIYQLGSEIDIDLFDDAIWDISDAPDDSDVYVDELGQVYPSRDFASLDNKRLTNELITLRHHGIRVFGCTQQASLIDLNILKFVTHLGFKYLQNPEYERQNVLTPFTFMMLPQNRFNKDELLLIYGKNNSFMEFKPDSRFFVDSVSKNARMPISREQLFNKARRLFRLGYTISEVKKYMQRNNDGVVEEGVLESIQKEVLTTNFIRK